MPSWFPRFFSLPKFSLLQLHFVEWRWWLGVAKNNLLLLVLVVALLCVTVEQMKREFTQCQQTDQLWSCLFSTDRTP
ncbi:hypothetical protein WKK05_11325 [Nostoc sp. UHCC 0302]|uniref:hypothetical protein n=1 Tax=Nostoc sp. UHCC 0302 TaxID=3134896 RepID=UPI00311C8AFF